MKKTIKDHGTFLKRLGELLSNGYSLTDAIEFVFIGHYKAQGAIRLMMLSQLQNGSSLSAVLHSSGLPLHVCSQIYFAERHGRIAETLIQAGEYLTARKKDREALMKVLTYPLVLISILIGVMILLKSVLFPQFEILYSSLDYTPENNLRLFLNIFENLPAIFLALLVASMTAGGIIYLRFQSYTPLKKAELLLRVPYVSRYIRLLYTQFFSREVSFLLNSGMSINQALTEMESQTYRPLFEEAAGRMIQDLKIGKSFPETIEFFGLFTDGFLEVIRHGERRGQLPQELFIYSQFCMETLEESGKNMLTVIQPVVFLFIGLFILLIYFSVMVPMFQVMQSLG
ncbi:type II secretion system F family protein [Rossellomorea vietnamensis]|uniref:Type II secretion system F family protein n=1 Tax=Rossellomorea vietnamensis TaxID=218284 RepID=A0A5D4MGU2_9BACI|nr:competence type IV pilus assembly protein ComGB [Rossellomorea vietnamensis]TYS00728.1 type II secretion system F family protein [Rossellomorea vietnamensis]